MTEEPTDLTALMSLDPLELTKQDLDKIIAYQRKQRVAREQGVKTKRATGEAPAVDIKALMNKVIAPKITPTFKPSDATPAKAELGKKPSGFVRRL